MKKTTLVIMAAGLGSRYGGIKQLEPVGPNGEIIMDYSIYDAIKAGFNKVVFVIRKEIEKDFIEIIGNRIQNHVEVDYVIQDIHKMPKGYDCPKGRIKPWGTGHAVLCCLGKVAEPFAVINADDYYGQEGFRLIHDELVAPKEADGRYHFCMAGFILENTLSENGTVARGICQVDDNHKLLNVMETTNLRKVGNNALGDNENGKDQKVELSRVVSMNMWGFTPEYLKELENEFITFLNHMPTDSLKAEFYLPQTVANLILEGKAEVEVLKTPDSWFGVTYKEDRDYVVSALKRLTEEGVYPQRLFS